MQGDCIAHREGRVDDFPQARKRKPVPERSIAMLVLRQGTEVLLEKRPQSGIWGGLWSLPEVAIDDDLREYCLRRFGIDDLYLSELPELMHGFTHFRLRIRPWRVDVGCLPASAMEPGSMWLSLDDARSAALPVPVRRILESQQ